MRTTSPSFTPALCVTSRSASCSRSTGGFFAFPTAAGDDAGDDAAFEVLVVEVVGGAAGWQAEDISSSAAHMAAQRAEGE